MKQDTYDMESSANNTNQKNINMDFNSFGGDKNIQRYYPSKPGKENQNSLSYKLREIKESQKKLQMNNNMNNNIMKKYSNDNNSNEPSMNNSNTNLIQNSQMTNQSKYSKYKNNNINNNLNYNNSNSNINNVTGNNSTISHNSNSNISNNNRKSSRQKNSTSTAQIDEQYEMQKLLELENKSANKYKENMYKKIKERENLKNNIPISKGYYNYNNYNLNNSNSNSNSNININNNLNNNFNKDNNNNNAIDKNIKDYIDEQAEKIKEFIHEEISNLHVDLIRQFEIQNSQNMKMMQEFSIINSQMCKEIEKLKNENKLLKEKYHI